MTKDKLLLVHVIALNRCMKNDTVRCSLDYKKSSKLLSCRHCSAIGYILTETCPITHYEKFTRFVGFHSVLKELLDWS